MTSAAKHRAVDVATVDYSVVVPTVGRDNLGPLLRSIADSVGPSPAAIVVVDDRTSTSVPLAIPFSDSRVVVVHSGGRGPAAARNTGWRACRSEWIAFVDDDVQVPGDWAAQLAADLNGLASDVAASQSRIRVPMDSSRRPTDDERRTAALAEARWITADMAYRRDVLARVGGFDERFPRAYREDSDLAARVIDAGYRIDSGTRVTDHPPAAGSFFASVKAQRGNRDNALMRRKFGPQWRATVGEGPGRTKHHVATTVAAVAAAGLWSVRRRRAALAAAALWSMSTLEFAIRRTLAGPRTAREIVSMAVTSVLIPPVAVTHRLIGEWKVRRPVRVPRVEAILFDRDNTLIVDVPYLSDPSRVEPVNDARRILDSLRAQGIRVGLVSNQSGVAKKLITPEQLEQVDARVDELLGPFDTKQYCVHDAEAGCGCRKPMPGMIVDAAAELGVDPASCVVIGDIGADVRAASAAGARAVLVPTARTRPEEVLEARQYAEVAHTLREAVDLALGSVR
ncbi:HAD-IIIA family hydrolase [Rhodococcus fascians]|nr:HAD-IIIA family hydrolase [Rhodococcus fascians]MBY4417654.1 HAD-IIIA family hydrolase [Rhodococcus fascians]